MNNRASADLPNVQVDDAAGPHLCERASHSDYPLSCFRVHEVPRRVDVDARLGSKLGRSGARENGSKRSVPVVRATQTLR
jgi:hypothetical protein